MQQAYDPLLYLVFPSSFTDTDLYRLDLDEITRDVLPLSVILHIYYDVENKNLIFYRLSELGFIKFFENFWASPKWMQEKNDDTLQEFFSFIAPVYESKIHPENNLACFEFLINIGFNKKYTKNSITLDYGCGSGISLLSPISIKLDKLIGFDISNEMRILSKNKGMNTLSPLEFNTLSFNQFDIIVLNYVLHLGVNNDSLNHLLDLLVVGGVLIGNIHKNLTLANITQWLELLVKEHFSYHIDNTQFGSIITIIKNQ